MGSGFPNQASAWVLHPDIHVPGDVTSAQYGVSNHSNASNFILNLRA